MCQISLDRFGLRTCSFVLLVDAFVVLLVNQKRALARPSSPSSKNVSGSARENSLCAYADCDDCRLVNEVPKCRTANGTFYCQYPKVFFRSIDPVCASDGETYDPPSLLTYWSCQRTEPLTLVHRGKCQKARNSQGLCRYLGIRDGDTPCKACVCLNCRETDGGYPRCGFTFYERVSCPYKCAMKQIKPLCGSDGISYKNPCELALAACWTKKAKSVAYWGACKI